MASQNYSTLIIAGIVTARKLHLGSTALYAIHASLSDVAGNPQAEQ